MVNATYDEIFGAALALPPGLRAMLAEHLLKSLDAPKQMELDELWAEEAEKRVQEVEQGVVTPVAGLQILHELRSRQKKEL